MLCGIAAVRADVMSRTARTRSRRISNCCAMLLPAQFYPLPASDIIVTSSPMAPAIACEARMLSRCTSLLPPLLLVGVCLRQAVYLDLSCVNTHIRPHARAHTPTSTHTTHTHCLSSRSPGISVILAVGNRCPIARCPVGHRIVVRSHARVASTERQPRVGPRL
jgi:hypothetical protein